MCLTSGTWLCADLTALRSGGRPGQTHASTGDDLVLKACNQQKVRHGKPWGGLGVFCCHYGVFPCWVFSVAFLVFVFVAWCFTLPYLWCVLLPPRCFMLIKAYCCHPGVFPCHFGVSCCRACDVRGFCAACLLAEHFSQPGAVSVCQLHGFRFAMLACSPAFF